MISVDDNINPQYWEDIPHLLDAKVAERLGEDWEIYEKVIMPNGLSFHEMLESVNAEYRPHMIDSHFARPCKGETYHYKT